MKDMTLSIHTDCTCPICGEISDISLMLNIEKILVYKKCSACGVEFGDDNEIKASKAIINAVSKAVISEVEAIRMDAYNSGNHATTIGMCNRILKKYTLK